MRFLLLAVALATFAVPTSLRAQSPAQTDSLKLDVAMRLLRLTRATDNFMQTLEQTIPGQRELAPEVPPAFWDSLMVRARRAAPELLARMAPAFTEVYSLDELKGLLAFYESPLGRRMIESQTLILKRSMQIGEQWGQELGMAVAADLMRSGAFNKPE